MAGKLKESLGISEVTSKNNNLWRALVAEFLGNVILNFFGCASVVNIAANTEDSSPNIVLIALTFGLAIFAIVHTIGHVSGGHVNPAVTVGMLVTGNIKVAKGILYIIVQCLGALAGSGLLKAITPEQYQLKLGKTGLGLDVSPVQGMGMEFFLGFILVLVVFGVCDKNRPEAKFAGPLAIGLTVTLGHLAAVDYTGSSMNPARSFGSAVIVGEFEDHWVYWVGPCLGGIAAALIYTYIFSAPSSNIVITTTTVERYQSVQADEKELKRLDGSGSKNDVNLP
ncbi:aquaporin AQPAn.G [Chrysoperla carnea]|uniref:aquaporin AQPAn.G n=1 Tax=Chrysoperla carnea TaxID=189513 RepID=UPI001D08237B|nr:aquaporin AQPAn.G [Chrysoperla carnea]